MSIFRHLMSSDIPVAELSTERLTTEAMTLLAAGISTVSGSLDLTMYYILANENIRARLSAELESVTSDFPERMPTMADLEKLPYLHAVVREGLR